MDAVDDLRSEFPVKCGVAMLGRETCACRAKDFGDRTQHHFHKSHRRKRWRPFGTCQTRLSPPAYACVVVATVPCYLSTPHWALLAPSACAQGGPGHRIGISSRGQFCKSAPIPLPYSFDSSFVSTYLKGLTAPGTLMTNLAEFIEGHRDKHLAELCEFLRIPSVSAKSEHKPDIERAARWVADNLRAAGFQKIEIVPTNLHPLVYAESLEVARQTHRPLLRPL